MKVIRSTTTKEVVRTETVADGFDLHVSDDEAQALRFILASSLLNRTDFTFDVTGVRNFVGTIHDLENKLQVALVRAGVVFNLSPFVLERR